MSSIRVRPPSDDGQWTMHGLVMALEDALDDLEMRDSLLIDMADHLAATRNWVIANMGNPDDMDALLARFAALDQRAGTA